MKGERLFHEWQATDRDGVRMRVKIHVRRSLPRSGQIDDIEALRRALAMVLRGLRGLEGDRCVRCGHGRGDL